jgi:hypothetical protein
MLYTSRDLSGPLGTSRNKHSIIECSDKEGCKYFFHPQAPSETTIHWNDAVKDKRERSTDFAINVLYVLGFIGMGDGPTEAGRLLGLLGLPNDTTMGTRSFGIIEERIAVIIRELCDEIINENLIEEAKLSMEASTQDHLDFNLWKSSLTDKTLLLPESKKPRVDASYDMAWQQKGSGHQYNSLSGHGTMVGNLTRKVIGLAIKSKRCNTCVCWEKKHPDIPVPDHTCWKTHEGSSGSMESAACVELIVDCYRSKNCIIRRLCCDDDSSIRADCQWCNADYLLNNNTDVLPMVPKKTGINKGQLQQRPDKGKLPRDVPEPLFIADPNHRCKGLTGDLIALAKAKVNDRMTMTRMDATRIGKNFGYMARTLKNRPESEFEDAAKAVLEHHFDCHENCGDWCKRRLESAAQKQASKKYYRSKTMDAKLYVVVQQTIARFITKDKLLEMAHGLDTNMNEAFNNICTWFAPKNKVFAGAYSLHNRIAFAVGINSLGVLEYFVRLYRKLGITMTDNVLHYLTKKEHKRSRKLAKVKTSEAKREKNKRKHDKLSKDVAVAKMELHKRLGTYRKGMNLDDPFGDEGAAENRPSKKQRTHAVFCEWCGRRDHVTKRSKKCTAPPDGEKKYRKQDGSLLTEPARLLVVEEDNDPMVDSVLFGVVADSDSCEDSDLQPLVHMPGEEGFDEDLFLLAELGPAASADDDSVAVVGGTL